MIDLPERARSLFASGKGILAADESVHTADARLAKFGIDPSLEMRRLDRELFLNAPEIESYLSGVILFSETLMQNGGDGVAFTQSLAIRGIQPGIKADEGTEPLPESPHELITNGLLGLTERLTDFKTRGCTFTKWRAVFSIDGDRQPTPSALSENVKRLASYAKEAQAAGFVPMVEPEVLLDGAHARSRAKDVLTQVLLALFSALEEQAVELPALILKTSMVLSGRASGKTDTPEEVAQATLDVLTHVVPQGVGGIVFLSGGQTPDQATDNLSAIVKAARIAQAPWPLTFSFARALQEEALQIWNGKLENIPAARVAFLSRLKKVSSAVA